LTGWQNIGGEGFDRLVNIENVTCGLGSDLLGRQCHPFITISHGMIVKISMSPP
jgi:hypothetical protein